MNKEKLKRINDYLWEIPINTRKDMQVPAYVIASEDLLDDMLKDKSLDQLINVSALPGIKKAALVMPDAHEGYGFPIGGIAATSWPDGIISPGGIGYDINCGVRLLKTELKFNDVKDKLEDLSKALYEYIPSGTGKGGSIKLSPEQMEEVLKNGASWAVENGYGYPDDLIYVESNGKTDNSDPSFVSDMAKKRGTNQLGTIGAGNHFVEVDEVEEIFHPEAAKAFGISKGQVVVLIHTGSRGLGHQVATDYIKKMLLAMPGYNIHVPDRQLACAPFNSREGKEYFRGMSAAANYAWCNRQVITWEIRNAWKSVFGESGGNVSLLYDVSHNIAKIEDHLINERLEKVIVHRKGATSSFGPNTTTLADAYSKIGQPVLIPGSMGTASYILVGTDKSMEMTFGSTCHGAGRRMSRRAAKKKVEGLGLKKELKDRGIYVEAGSIRGIAEEAPIAYKDVDLVVEAVNQAGISLKVARLKPLAVIKG